MVFFHIILFRIIDTILKNELNDFVLRIENENSTFNDCINIEKTVELLSEYSSELKFKRNIEKFELSLAKKRDELKLLHENTKTSEIDRLDSSLFKIDDINLNFNKLNIKEDIFKSYPQIFTKEFDIIDFSKNIGKDLNFSIVCANIFEKNEMFVKIYKQTFIKFVEQMGRAYVSRNPYHNVSI
jgi:hypothetical protein